MSAEPLGLINCPLCKTTHIKGIDLHTEWGIEVFFECLECGIIFREITK